MNPAFGTINRQTWINHMQNPNRTAMNRIRILELNRLILEENYKCCPKRRGANLFEAIKSSYKESYYGMPFSDRKAMHFCWNIAESLVDILVNYAKYNGHPDFTCWSDIVQDEDFAVFIGDLYSVTEGSIYGFFWDDSALEFLRNKYDDQYESLSNFIFSTDCINISMKWIVERFPTHPKRREDASRNLFNKCAELIKYTYINTAGDFIIGIDSTYPEQILRWNPSKALAALCLSFNDGVPNEYSFCMDQFHQTIESVCDNYIGNYWLLIYFTNVDPDVKEGALKLIAYHDETWQYEDAAVILELIKSIIAVKNKEERQRYASLLPSVEDFSKRTVSEDIIAAYREHLEICLSKN